MPVRKIPRSYTTVRGRLHFPYRGWHLGYESQLERDFFILQFYNEHVVEIEEQPMHINWQDKNGRQRQYTPDALITYSDNSKKLFEIKSKYYLKKDAKKLAPKFAAATIYANEQGWKFCIANEDDIRTPRLANSKFLYFFASERTPPHHAACFFHALQAKGGKASGVELLKHVAGTEEEKNVMKRSLWQLLAQEKLLVNLDKPLNERTILHLNPSVWFVLQEQVD